MSLRTLIVWFRRDLRLHDQQALHNAMADAGCIVPLFILDPALTSAPHVGGPRLAFLLESLRVLDCSLRSLGSSLIVRQGDPVIVLPDLVKEINADGVYFNRDYVWPGRDRDTRVIAALKKQGTAVRTFQDQVLVEPNALLSTVGKPYTVFSPYKKAWLSLEKPDPVQGPQRSLNTPVIPKLEIPSIEAFGLSVPDGLQEAGESAGQRLLRQFTSGSVAPITNYAQSRNFPALPGTSTLSPHLRHGSLGIRTAFAAARASTGPSTVGADTWISELAWRDFYHQWVWHYPEVLTHSFNPAFDAMRYDNDQTLFAAWKAGMTGYPLVDAAMRQLNSTGWMHNRVRMIVASFLCKDLLCDWRWGEQYFWERLIDGDKPANVGGWQWSASTGADAQPYFRIFNPTTQSQRFDPDGTFIRTWVPELSQVPIRYLHAPQEMPPLDALAAGFRLDREYPSPIVDHQLQRQRALELFGKAKSESAARVH